MPCLAASVPKYRKHKASGQAIVELHGRRYYLGTYGTQASKTEYDRLIAEWLARGRHPAPAVSRELTVCQIAAWRSALKRDPPWVGNRH